MRSACCKAIDFGIEFIPEVAQRIEHYPGERPIFDLYSVEDEIQKALDRKVMLKSGGYLILDQTEAMTTIDVNTGAYVGHRNLEETIYRTNLEAAVAIAEFYRRFDRLPIDHAHGMLCNQVSLLLLYEATKEPDHLARVEKRWEELVQGGYISLLRLARDAVKPARHNSLRPAGVAALVEEAVRLARNRRRISARFSDVADILRESAFLARQGGARTIGTEQVRAAVRARRDRHSLPEEKLTSFMLDGVLHEHGEPIVA